MQPHPIHTSPCTLAPLFAQPTLRCAGAHAQTMRRRPRPVALFAGNPAAGSTGNATGHISSERRQWCVCTAIYLASCCHTPTLAVPIGNSATRPLLRVQDKHRQTDAPVSLFPSPLPPRPIHSHTHTQSRQVQVTVTAHYSSDTFGPDWNACFPSFLVYLIGRACFPSLPVIPRRCGD